MPGPPRKVSKPTGWRSTDGNTAPPQIGPRRRWQPGEDPGRPRRSGRMVKIAAVVGGLVAAASGLGYLISVMWEPNPPRLVVVGADPAQDCLRLDVPPDYAGWTTGKQLIQWGRAEEAAAGQSGLTARVVASPTDPDAPATLPADEAGLADWAGQLAGNRFARSGRVLIYLGLHAGVGRDGKPFLHTGQGAKLPVEMLLTALAAKLDRREVIVLFDPGRLAADPLLGRLADRFAERLVKDDQVNKVLAKHKKMVLVCGAGPGEVGWESEELQATAFGHAVLRGLRGEAESAKGGLRVAELFAFAKSATEAWTGGNRPTRQTPVLLDNGDGRAAGMVAGYRRPDPAPAASPTDLYPDRLAELWKQHDTLSQRVPSPTAYAPLAWRRGRELLLRYQQAVRAGERGAASMLARAVSEEFQRAEAANPSAVDRSRPNSLPLAETFGDKAAEAEKQLARADQPDGWRAIEFDKLNGLGVNRPCEALLACLVDDFYRKHAAGDPPAAWRDALRVRRLAERAAFGGGPFGERSWPAVRADVTATDPRRREAEDRLFASSPDDHARAKKLLDDAEASYKRAAALGAAVRDGSRLRDDLFADLPFVGRWAAASGTADAVDKTVLAWNATHALAASLDAPGAGLVGARDAADAAYKTARGLLAVAERKLGTPPESPDAWQDQQHLLDGPLVKADTRMAALAASRALTRRLLDGNATRTGEDEAGRAVRAKAAAGAHALLTAHALGEPRLNAFSLDGKLRSFLGLIDDARTLGAAADDKWFDLAVALGDAVLGHVRRAADGIVPKDYKDQAEADARERDSRTTVLLAADGGKEPAEVAAALRWRVLLGDLARRTFADHWYDEGGEPYWQLAANRYRDDADRAYRSDLPRVATLPPVPDTYTKTYPLRVAAGADTPNPLSWTSQRRRAVSFQVVSDFPDEVKAGLAVAWPTADAGPLRWDVGADRRPLGVDRAGKLERALVLKDLTGDDADLTVTPVVRAFFRGQQPNSPLTVKLNRRAEREIREPLPLRTEAAVAVRAERDVPLGQMVILLDLSGSMKQYLNGKGESNRPYDDKQTTKFRAMLDELRKVLLYLPKGTPVQIRQFSAYDRDPDLKKPQPARPVAAVVYPRNAAAPGAVAWDGPDNTDFKNLMERFAGYHPHLFTPLVDSIRAAARDGFVRPSALAKTLVVLTDGVEEDEDDNLDAKKKPRPAADRDARIRAKMGRLKTDLWGVFKEGDGRDVGLFVVPFGQNASDRALCGELFADVSGYPVPGRLLPAVDAGASIPLEDALLAAIFPKLMLREVGSGTMARNLVSTGLPSRPDRNRRPPYSNANGGMDLRWSPWLPPGTYTAASNVSTDGVRLTLAEADTIVLGFERDAAGKLQVRRELHSEYFHQFPWKTKRQEGNRWAVTCPHPGAERQRLEAKVFVERVPPHKQAANAGPADITAHPPDRFGDGTELVWFDVLSADPTMKPGKLTVERVYGHAAPCWKLVREGWTDPKVKVQVRAVIATQEDRDDRDRLPDPVKLKLRLPAADGETVAAVPGEGLEVRLAVERRAPDGREEADQSWLTVRVSHPAGKPVFARLLADGVRRVEAVHRYYPPAEGRAESTAAFKVATADLRRLSEVRVNLAAVGWALDESRVGRMAVTLDPATPDTETSSGPEAITPPPPGDR